MNNAFTTAILQLHEVAVKGAVCFALVPAIRLILSTLKTIKK